jgi:hypothetical protein
MEEKVEPDLGAGREEKRAADLGCGSAEKMPPAGLAAGAGEGRVSSPSSSEEA